VTRGGPPWAHADAGRDIATKATSRSSFRTAGLQQEHSHEPQHGRAPTGSPFPSWTVLQGADGHFYGTAALIGSDPSVIFVGHDFSFGNRREVIRSPCVSAVPRRNREGWTRHRVYCVRLCVSAE
jgi:hypothetical protein